MHYKDSGGAQPKTTLEQQIPTPDSAPQLELQLPTPDFAPTPFGEQPETPSREPGNAAEEIERMLKERR